MPGNKPEKDVPQEQIAEGRFARLLKNFLLMIGTIIVMGVICEVVVRIRYKETTVLFPRYQTDAQYGEFRLRKNRPNSDYWHTSADGSWRFTINNKGFRSNYDFQYEKKPGTVRVLCLGDSHTMGYEASQDDIYSNIAERYLRRHGLEAEVMNTGLSGFGTAEELLFLENEGIRYQPDVVVLGFYANDFEDNVRCNFFQLVGDSLVLQKKEHAPGTKIQNVIYSIPGIQWLSENSYFYSLLFNSVWDYVKTKRYVKEGTQAQPPGVQVTAEELAIATRRTYSEYEIRLAARLIRRMSGFCRNRGIGFIIADLPRYDTQSSSFPREMRDEMKSLCDAYVGSDSLVADWFGAMELHRLHGHHHITEAVHAVYGIAIGKSAEQYMKARQLSSR